MSLTRKIAFNTFIQLIGKVVTTAISLVIIGALTRYLGVNGFGEYTTIFAYVSFAGVLADLGFFWIMVREISKDETQIQKIVNNTMTLRGLIGLCVFIIGFLVSLLIPQYSFQIKMGIGVISLAWLWTTLNSTYVGVFQTKMEMYKATLSEVIGRIVIFGLVMIFINLHYSLVGIMFAYVIGNIINFVTSVILGQKHLKFALAFDFALWKKMFVDALPMGIVLLLGLIYFKIDAVMLSLMKGSTEVGIYGAPYKILEIMLLVPTIFMGNIFPILTKYINDKDSRVNLTIQKAFDFLTMLSFPIIVGTILLSTQIIRFVAGEEFVSAHTLNIFNIPANSALVLQILIVAVGLSFISVIFNNTVISLGKQRELIKPYLVLVLVNILLNLILIPKISYIGSSVSTVITELLVLIFTAQIVFNNLPKLTLSLNNLYKTMLSAIIMGLLIFFIRDMNLFFVVFSSIFVYGLFLYLLGGISPELIKSIVKKESI
jgi:O-antigen/teichoic acid export membrane protein